MWNYMITCEVWLSLAKSYGRVKSWCQIWEMCGRVGAQWVRDGSNPLTVTAPPPPLHLQPPPHPSYPCSPPCARSGGWPRLGHRGEKWGQSEWREASRCRGNEARIKPVMQHLELLLCIKRKSEPKCPYETKHFGFDLSSSSPLPSHTGWKQLFDC